MVKVGLFKTSQTNMTKEDTSADTKETQKDTCTQLYATMQKALWIDNY